MKTIEEKALRYDEAIDKVAHFIKKHIGFGCAIHPNSLVAKELFNIFPELKESEDEKIRKGLINYFNDFTLPTFGGLESKKILSWLEKQGKKDEEILVLKDQIESLHAAIKAIKNVHKIELEKQVENNPYSGVSFKYNGHTWGMCARDNGVDILLDKQLFKHLEKQGEASIHNTPSREVILAIWDLGNEWKELTNGSISTEYGTQLNYIQNHWQESEYYLRAMQGEYNHTDKTEPKFKNGQWIVWQDKCYKVNYNGCGYELVDQNGLSTSLEYGTIDENAHLWDITKDAKDGDVLAAEPIEGYSSSFVAICKKLNEEDFDSYCFVGFDGYFYEDERGHSTKNIHPATKEQRDTLMKEMADEGYTFDFEKKELKKIEQKPTDKVEPKYNVGDWLVHNEKKYIVKIVNYTPFDYKVVNALGYHHTITNAAIENNYHIWTIQDAKDGDVLFMDNGLANCIFIYKSFNNGIINKYASYNNFGFEGEHYLVLNDGYVIPATNEQRDLLFQKMKEAEYEWDADKKELKKIL